MTTDPKSVAESILTDYSLSNPPIDTISIAKALGLNVSVVSFSSDISDRIRGFLDINDMTVYINEKESTISKLHVAAHEIGHFLLHPEYVRSDDYKIYGKTIIDTKECKEAEVFSSYLQIPRHPLERLKDYSSVEELASAFMVESYRILQAIKDIA